MQSEFDVTLLKNYDFFSLLIDFTVYLTTRYGQRGAKKAGAISNIIFVPSASDDDGREGRRVEFEGSVDGFRFPLSRLNVLSIEGGIKTSVIKYG